MYVNAGGMHGMTNNVSVTSQANFLTIENIIATGNAAVAMNRRVVARVLRCELLRGREHSPPLE